MTLRAKLLLLFAPTVVAAVTVLAWGTSRSIRRQLGPLTEQRSDSLVAQFQRELRQRGAEVTDKVATIAEAEGTVRTALDLSQPQADPSLYARDAAGLAADLHLDFLDLVNDDGTVISSARWPEQAGYKNDWVKLETHWNQQGAFLRRVSLPDGVEVGLLAVRVVHVGDRNLYVIGGRRIDRSLLGDLVAPAGSRALLYLNFETAFVPGALTDASGAVTDAARFAPLIQSLQSHAGMPSAQPMVASAVPSYVSPGLARGWLASLRGAPQERLLAVPMMGRNGEVLGAFLAQSFPGEMTALLSDMRSLALLVAVLAILSGLLLSRWLSEQMVRPLRQVIECAQAMAGKNWDIRAKTNARGECGDLARAFNDMAQRLVSKRERLVQAERVAAWREMAHRLTSQMKVSLFPLQVTLETLVHAREKSRWSFDKAFSESAGTLQREIEELKTIMARFGEFAKMPAPRLQPVNLNDLLRAAVKRIEPSFSAIGRPPIAPELFFDEHAEHIQGDLEWLHKAFEILLLLCIEAMPTGGALTIRTGRENDLPCATVSYTGAAGNMASNGRIFTPYDPAQQRGKATDLGLATVQAVVSDHGGEMFMESVPGAGTTYRLAFPVAPLAASDASDRAPAAPLAGTATVSSEQLPSTTLAASSSSSSIETAPRQGGGQAGGEMPEAPDRETISLHVLDL